MVCESCDSAETRQCACRTGSIAGSRTQHFSIHITGSGIRIERVGSGASDASPELDHARPSSRGTRWRESTGELIAPNDTFDAQVHRD